ncbi:glycoside hydrolase [Streptomyces sp. NPDC089919]|uniref:glycoside hydrolase n=1 Tax=Streptomyces sp. NPDC089919 TaxID=3155188 RepID=UPI00343E4DDE
MPHAPRRTLLHTALLTLTGGALALGPALSAAATATGPAAPAAPRVRLAVAGGTAEIDPAGLAVSLRPAGGGPALTASAAGAGLGKPSAVTTDSRGARWSYPGTGLSVTAKSAAGRLVVTVHADRDTTVRWPVTGTDRTATALQLPKGEGLSVPVADRWWNTAAGLAGQRLDLAAGLTLPLWGYTAGRQGISYLSPDALGTTLAVDSRGGRLGTTAVHAFAAAEQTRDYTVSFRLTDASPVAPALDYRSWLADSGRLSSLRAKIRANPDTAKLTGAFHAYVWGDARTAEGIDRLRKLGVSRMWLGYDPGNGPMSPAAIAAAKKDGYLVGSYDSFANAQDPATSDSPTSTWPAPVWNAYCVRNADGSIMTGFGGRGCYVSSQALATPEGRTILDRHVDTFSAGGMNSYFLDVDAAGEFFDDHTPGHRMNQRRDRANRLRRMADLTDRRRLVLGSESAGSWANGVLAFSHGSATPVADALWPLERDRDVWGGYAPAKAPAIFFKPVHLPADLSKAMFDPRYRVPLLETALHDAVVNADRWELSYEKLPDQKRDRALLAMLYNVPLNYVLDGPSLDRHGKDLARLQSFFAGVHRVSFLRPMTSFRWLTADHAVQRTVFGSGALTMTANFGTTPREGVRPGCVRADFGTGAASRTLCP